MIKIFKGEDNQWYVSHIGKNGKTLCSSEGFKTRANAIKNIRAMIKLYREFDFMVKDETTNEYIDL